MDQGETSVRGALILFSIICVGILAVWIVVGPGGALLATFIGKAGIVLKVAADWYQDAIEGPSKLIAPAITIASGSYAIYKGYAYAERRLHYRLGDYIEREEKRLADARRQLRLIIERPSVERRFREPIFLEPSLKRAVRELRWGSYLLGPQLGYVSFQLDTSIVRLERQAKLAGERHRHLERQLATAHLLRGAMDVAGAEQTRQATEDARMAAAAAALGHFSAALLVNKNDCDALEYAAHMHVLLKQDAEAEKALDRLLKVTAGQSKSLNRARGLRYKSQLEASRTDRRQRARDLARGALNALPNLLGEDRFEEAEMNEELGFRQLALGAHREARARWELAAVIFAELKSSAAKDASTRVAHHLSQLAASDSKKKN